MKVCYTAGPVKKLENCFSVSTNAVEIRIWFLTDDILRIRAGFDGDWDEASYSLTMTAWDSRTDELMKDFLAAYPGAHYGEGEGHTITYVFDTEVGKITIPKPTAQLPVGTLQDFLDQWMQTHSGRIDYVHGDDVTWELGRKPGNIGFLLPAMGKDELFKTVIFDGALPRKTFSMGEAHDKRFYLEARKIK